MSSPEPTVRAGVLVSRIRMPLVAAAVLLLSAPLVLDVPPWWGPATVVLFLVSMALYIRAGIPDAIPVDLAPPVRGRWLALNSPTTRVPSHRINAWSQTYAIDLVDDPECGGRPEMAWWPLARRPQDYPGFGEPVLASVNGTVVRSRDFMRDHWSRSSPASLVYFVLESVREFLGPIGVLGNHVVIRSDNGAHVLVAHLRRRSVIVSPGERVEAGDPIAECGNSGNSTEPHVHVQAMDGPSTWIAAAMPIRIAGQEPPGDGEHLTSTCQSDL